MKILYGLWDIAVDDLVENSIRSDPELIARLWCLYEIGEPGRYEIVRGYEESELN